MEILGEDKLFDIALECLEMSPYHAVKEIEDVRYTLEEPQVVEVLVLEFKNEEAVFIFHYLHDGIFVLRRSFERENFIYENGKFISCDDLGRPLEQDELPFEEDVCEGCDCSICFEEKRVPDCVGCYSCNVVKMCGDKHEKLLDDYEKALNESKKRDS